MLNTIVNTCSPILADTLYWGGGGLGLVLVIVVIVLLLRR